jgi:hypothetical protein
MIYTDTFPMSYLCLHPLKQNKLSEPKDHKTSSSCQNGSKLVRKLKLKRPAIIYILTNSCFTQIGKFAAFKGYYSMLLLIKKTFNVDWS